MNHRAKLVLEHNWVHLDERVLVQTYLDWMGDDYPASAVYHDTLDLLQAVRKDSSTRDPAALWVELCMKDPKARQMMVLWATYMGTSSARLKEACQRDMTALLPLMRDKKSSWTGWLGSLWPLGGFAASDLASHTSIKALMARLSAPLGSSDLLKHTQAARSRGYRHHFYLLLSESMNLEEAGLAVLRYQEAIRQLAVWPKKDRPVGLSVRLSALYPKRHPSEYLEAVPRLVEAMRQLIQEAKAHEIALTIEAEHSTALNMSLAVMDALLSDPLTEDYRLLGYTVQAYTKVAPVLIARLAERARAGHRQLRIRLVKGGYWTQEIEAWMDGHAYDCPVFTDPAWTDLSYLRCLYALRDASDVIYAQCATHDANLWVAAHRIMGLGRRFEFESIPALTGAMSYRMILMSGGAIRPCVYLALGEPGRSWFEWCARFYGSGRGQSYHVSSQEAQPARQLLEEARVALEREPRFAPTRRTAMDWHDARHVWHTELSRDVPAPACDRSVDSWHAVHTRWQEDASAQWHRLSYERRKAAVSEWVELLEQDVGAWVEAALAQGMPVLEATRAIHAALHCCHRYLSRTDPEHGAHDASDRRDVVVQRDVGVCLGYWEPDLALDLWMPYLMVGLLGGMDCVLVSEACPDLVAQFLLNKLSEARIPLGVVQFYRGGRVQDFGDRLRVVCVHERRASFPTLRASFGTHRVSVLVHPTDVWYVSVSDDSARAQDWVEDFSACVLRGSGLGVALWCCHDAVYEQWMGYVRERVSGYDVEGRIQPIDMDGLLELSSEAGGLYLLRYQDDDQTRLMQWVSEKRLSALSVYTALQSRAQRWLTVSLTETLYLNRMPVSWYPRQPEGTEGVHIFQGSTVDIERCMPKIHVVGRGPMAEVLRLEYTVTPAQ